MNVLVTGGAGYLGSHTVAELLKSEHSVVVIDSLVNGKQEAIRRVGQITKTKIIFYKLDLRDTESLKKIFKNHSFDVVIHFAGLKAVGESVKNPLQYYQNNLISTLSLLEVMSNSSVKRLVFSSSATVYDLNQKSPIRENFVTGVNIQNPYGQTKYMIEQFLKDLARSDENWSIASLRYFNPIGAHPSGTIGEDPLGTPNNLLPYILQVGVRKRKVLNVFGDDYNTPDGTGIRDYIHIEDLACGHIAAINHMDVGFNAFNLGTGCGTSVLELIAIFEEATKVRIPYRISSRRDGDAEVCFADPSLAERKLEWKANKTIFQACQDSWRWQSSNPEGYL